MTAQTHRDPVAKRLPSQPKPEGYRFGRPTKYQSEYCQLVIERMGQGLSLTAFAGTIGVTKSAVYQWGKAHADFDDALSRARPARTLWLERKLWRSQDDAETMATLFALRNADPIEWGDRRTVNVNVPVERLTDAELLAIIANGPAL